MSRAASLIALFLLLACALSGQEGVVQEHYSAVPFVELYWSGHMTDYPLRLLQVRLNAKSEETGQIIADAKIRFNKKAGHYGIESYGNQYIKVVNVRPLR